MRRQIVSQRYEPHLNITLANGAQLVGSAIVLELACGHRAYVNPIYTYTGTHDCSECDAARATTTEGN